MIINLVQFFVTGITKYYHFEFKDDALSAKKFVDSEPENFHLRLQKDNAKTLPSIISPEGLSLRCVHTDKNLVVRHGTTQLCDIKHVVVVGTVWATCVVRHFMLCDHVMRPRS